MSSLNLSANGPSINKSYTSVVSAPAPTGAAAASPTYGQWAVFSVAAPLVSAFGGDAGKESTLKVQSTGEGELVDLIEEFSDGRIQFAFVKVKDPNTGLPKSALIGWCGEGVPERTKGYFASHQAAVAKVFHGYHVQISARSDRDLTPEGIIQKVSDASGAKYSGGGTIPSASSGPPPVAKKPVFGPTTSSRTAGGFNPLANRRAAAPSGPVDDDGWGNDAPPVTRTQLEKVESAYKPTKVDMRALTSASNQAAPAPAAARDVSVDRPDVVKGAYQPVGKVDIAAIRRQAAESGKSGDDRPTIVKGAYEPVGKVDIAAIRAKAQPPSGSFAPSAVSPSQTGGTETEQEAPKSLADRSSAFQSPGRLAELPKPKVANKFGGGGGFAGTKPLNPGTFGLHGAVPSAGGGLGSAGRSFAESSGKTPAQVWAEKKAAAGGAVAPVPAPAAAQPVAAQNSGGWKSGYEGKKWGAVQTSKVGGAAASSAEHDDDIAREEPVSSERAAPEPPALNTFNKPGISGGVAMPGLPSRPKAEDAQAIPPPPAVPRSPTPPAEEEEEEPSSPIRMAVPVARSAEPEVQDAHDEQMSPPPALPMASIAKQVSHEPEDDEPERGPDPGRQAAEGAAAAQFGEEATAAPAAAGGASATALYDYEAAESNELSFPENATITGIEFVDEDWWLGNYGGQQGLFPANYVEILEDGAAGAAGAGGAGGASAQAPVPTIQEPVAAASGHTATAVYDYEAGEDNELSFSEGDKITNVEFPDEDWWSGTFGGREGLFPANYVQLDE